MTDQSKHKHLLIVYCLFFAVIVGMAIHRFIVDMQPKGFVYDTQMHAYILADKEQKLNEAISRFNLDAPNLKYYSLYSSALNIKINKYNEHLDYAIHAFGQYRLPYLEQVKAADIIETPSMKVSLRWLSWSRAGNFDIYSIIFTQYHLIFDGGYFILWGRNTSPTNYCTHAQMSIQALPQNSYNIIIHTTDMRPDLVGVVSIAYTSGYTHLGDRLNHLIYRLTALSNFEGFSNYGLPSHSAGKLIPVYIKNGYGKTTILMPPAPSAFLNLKAKFGGCGQDGEVKLINDDNLKSLPEQNQAGS